MNFTVLLRRNVNTFMIHGVTLFHTCPQQGIITMSDIISTSVMLPRTFLSMCVMETQKGPSARFYIHSPML